MDTNGPRVVCAQARKGSVKCISNGVLDEFLPFSLLHIRTDQYRFSGVVSQAPASEVNNTSTIAGYHDQVFLDRACRRFFSPPSSQAEANVTRCETYEPIYNDDLILELIRTGLSNEHWLLYSKVVSEHSITPTVATADGAREALLCHLFPGGCLSGNGTQCRQVVKDEQSSESIAIRIIDLVLEWVDCDKLLTQDLARICNAIGLVPSVTRQRRSLLTKLAGHRRHLIRTRDASLLSLQDTLHKLGSSSTLETVRAMCSAHNILGQDSKAELVEQLVDHITLGNVQTKVLQRVTIS